MKEEEQKARRFLTSLEAENEEIMTKRMYGVKEVEQHIRETEFAIAEVKKKTDPNIDLFSPVGVRERSDSVQMLRQELEEWKEKLPVLQEQVEERRQRKSEIENLKKVVEKYGKIKKSMCDAPENTDKYRLLETQELERNRIARDLHDSTVQNMTMLVHKAELCMKILDKDPVQVRLELQTMIESIKATINDMREIIYNLRPLSSLDDLDLAAILESYRRQLQESSNIETELNVVGNEPKLMPVVKATLYQIVQEACNNIIEHANAAKIQIRLVFTEQEIELAVQDDGIGFDKICGEEDRPGFGLPIMKERTDLLAGSFEIVSEAAKGTTVRVKVPFEAGKEKFNGSSD